MSVDRHLKSSPATGSGPTPRQGLRVQEVGDELVILDRRQGKVHQLNHTAGFVWRRCDGNSAVEAIASEVARVFQVDGEQASRDTRDLVAKLTDLGLLDHQDRGGESV